MNCTKCNAPMILGVTPASKGWCSAECDLGGKVSAEKSFTFWALPEGDGNLMRPLYPTRLSRVRIDTHEVLFVLDGDYMVDDDCVIPGSKGAVWRRVFSCLPDLIGVTWSYPIFEVSAEPIEYLASCYLQGEYRYDLREDKVVIRPGLNGVTFREVVV